MEFVAMEFSAQKHDLGMGGSPAAGIGPKFARLPDPGREIVLDRIGQELAPIDQALARIDQALAQIGPEERLAPEKVAAEPSGHGLASDPIGRLLVPIGPTARATAIS